MQTTPVLHTDGSAPGSCQCADELADVIRFTYRWLCTEKLPMRGRTCRRRLFSMPLAMHREAANARAHLQAASALHTTDYAQRSRQCAGTLADGVSTAAMPHAFSAARSSHAPCTAQRPVCSAGTGMPLSTTTRAHGKCAYAMSRRMPNRPQLTPAGMSAQPQRKHNARKVRPARVRRLRLQKERRLPAVASEQPPRCLSCAPARQLPASYAFLTAA